MKNKTKIIIQILIIILLSLVGCSQKPVPTPEDSKSNNLEEQEDVNTEALRIFMDGQFQMNQGDYAMAIIEFQDALDVDPTVATIHVSMAECYWNLGKLNRALLHLNRAIELDSTDVDARERLAHYFILKKQFVNAEKEYNSLTEIDPKNPDYIYALADLAKIQEQYDKAISLYEKVYAMDASALFALETAAKLALSLQKFEKAEKLYKELTEIDTENASYWHVYSNLVLSHEDYDEGILALENYDRIKPKNIDTVGRIGSLYYEKGDLVKALSYFKQALELDSANALTYHYLSSILREQKEFDEALIYAQEMVIRFPENAQGYINGALIFLEEEKNLDAINLLDPIADKFMDEFAIQYLLGSTYYQLKQLDEAEIHLDRSVKISPHSIAAWHSLAIVYDNVMKFEDSDSIYEKLIRGDSTDVQAFNNYAYSLGERSENLEYALKLSEKSNKLSVDNAAYLDTMGWIYFKMGDVEKALKYVQQSVELDPTNSVVLEHLGDILGTVNRTDDARAYYEKALELDNNNERIQSKINEL